MKRHPEVPFSRTGSIPSFPLDVNNWSGVPVRLHRKTDNGAFGQNERRGNWRCNLFWLRRPFITCFITFLQLARLIPSPLAIIFADKHCSWVYVFSVSSLLTTRRLLLATIIPCSCPLPDSVALGSLCHDISKIRKYFIIDHDMYATSRRSSRTDND